MHRYTFVRPLALAVGLLALAIGAAAPGAPAAHAAPYRTSTLRADTVTPSSITIRWDAAFDALVIGHGIGTDATPDGTWVARPLTFIEEDARVLTFTGLQPSRTYTFQLADVYSGFAIALGYDSPRITSLTVTTLPPPPPPAAPTNLHLCGAGSQPEVCQGGGVLLYWRDNATNEDSYQFQWAKGQTGTLPGASAYTTMTLAANRSSYTFSPPSSGYYYFRVRACNVGGCSAFSNVVERNVFPTLSSTP